MDGGEGRRRAPEKSVLLEAFRRGWAAVSGCVPTRVKLEAQRYLDCGQLYLFRGGVDDLRRCVRLVGA